jgi:hypothetical protein
MKNVRFVGRRIAALSISQVTPLPRSAIYIKLDQKYLEIFEMWC